MPFERTVGNESDLHAAQQRASQTRPQQFVKISEVYQVMHHEVILKMSVTSVTIVSREVQ